MSTKDHSSWEPSSAFLGCELLYSPRSNPRTQAILSSPTGSTYLRIRGEKGRKPLFLKDFHHYTHGVSRVPMWDWPSPQPSADSALKGRKIALYHQIISQAYSSSHSILITSSSQNTKTNKGSEGEYLYLPQVYCFWNTSGVSREKDDALPCPTSFSAPVPTYFPGAVDKSSFGVWEGKDNSKGYSQSNIPSCKGKQLHVEECSKRIRHGITEVKYLQLHTPNVTFFLSLATSLQVHVTKKQGLWCWVWGGVE